MFMFFSFEFGFLLNGYKPLDFSYPFSPANKNENRHPGQNWMTAFVMYLAE